MNLFELFVKIGVDDQASGAVSKITQGLGNGLKTAAKVGTAAVTAVTGATVAFAGALVNATGDLAEYGDNIDKMSQKMGLSAQAYQEWDFIMQHSGTSIESLQAGMKTLANAVENGNDAFERLGITQEEIASMSNEDLFSATISALQQVTNETERTYLAGQLLGRGATELGALLNTSAEATEEMRQQLHDLGGVMSDEAVKASAAYQDSLQNMQTAFAGIKRGIVSDFLPSITSVMDGLALVFSGDDSGVGKITDGVDQIVENFSNAVPKIFQIGESILPGVSDAITTNLPKLAQSGLDMVLELANGITGNAPQILNTGVDILTNFANGVTENLQNGSIYNATASIIDTAVDFLTDKDGKLTEFVGAAGEMVVALGGYLEDASGSIADGIAAVINYAVDWVLNPENTKELKKAGEEIVTVIKDAAVNFAYAAGQIADNIFTEVSKAIKNADWKSLGNYIENAIGTSPAAFLYESLEGFANGFAGLSEEEVALDKELKEWYAEQHGGGLLGSVVGGVEAIFDEATGELPEWYYEKKENMGQAWYIAQQAAEAGTASPEGEGWSGIMGESFGARNVYVTQNIYSQAQTAADLMEEAQYEQQRALLTEQLAP